MCNELQWFKLLSGLINSFSVSDRLSSISVKTIKNLGAGQWLEELFCSHHHFEKLYCLFIHYLVFEMQLLIGLFLLYFSLVTVCR